MGHKRNRADEAGVVKIIQREIERVYQERMIALEKNINKLCTSIQIDCIDYIYVSPPSV